MTTDRVVDILNKYNYFKPNTTVLSKDQEVLIYTTQRGCTILENCPPYKSIQVEFLPYFENCGAIELAEPHPHTAEAIIHDRYQTCPAYSVFVNSVIYKVKYTGYEFVFNDTMEVNNANSNIIRIGKDKRAPIVRKYADNSNIKTLTPSLTSLVRDSTIKGNFLLASPVSRYGINMGLEIIDNIEPYIGRDDMYLPSISLGRYLFNGRTDVVSMYLYHLLESTYTDGVNLSNMFSKLEFSNSNSGKIINDFVMIPFNNTIALRSKPEFSNLYNFLVRRNRYDLLGFYILEQEELYTPRDEASLYDYYRAVIGDDTEDYDEDIEEEEYEPRF